MKGGAETQAMIINYIILARLRQQGQDSYMAQGDTASIRGDTGMAELPSGSEPVSSHTH